MEERELEGEPPGEPRGRRGRSLALQSPESSKLWIAGLE